MKNVSKTTIFVNPVQRISEQGRHKQVFTVVGKTGEIIPLTGMNKTREFGTAAEYSFRINYNTNKLVTGLENPIINPFKGLTAQDVISQYDLGQNWYDTLTRVVQQDNIKLQTYYEVLDKTTPNYYTSDVPMGTTMLNSISSKEIPELTYLQRFKIILYDRPNMFDDSTPRGRIAIQLIKNHNAIALNKQVVNSSVHAWYISQEEEAEKERNAKREVISEANYELVKVLREQSPRRIYELASILLDASGIPIARGVMSETAVKDALYSYIETGTTQFANIEKFLETVKLLNGKENLKRFKVIFTIQQALNTNVIGVRDGYFTWFSKSAMPNIYKFHSKDKLISLMISEFETYNSEDTSTNWYGELKTEIENKGVKIDG